MKLIAAILTAALLAESGDSHWVERLAFWTRADVQRIEQRVAEIGVALHTLPELAQINSSPSIGFKSDILQDEEQPWVEVTLPETTLMDSVVLLPVLAKGATGVLPGYGFPVRFKVEAFDVKDAATVVLDATASDFENPSCHPVRVTFKPLRAKRVRLTATEPWRRDGSSVLALAEMLIFNGERDVALGARVKSSSTYDSLVSWNRRNLVDLVTQLGLPAATGARYPHGFHSAVATQADAVKSITLTLPAPLPVDEVRLVPVRMREVPLWYAYGFPVRFKIESATLPDFSDARVLFESTSGTVWQLGMNIWRCDAHDLTARYLRITTKELWKRRDDFVFALAELQVFSGGANVALGAAVKSSDLLAGDDAWSLTALTDGCVETQSRNQF